jgi:chromosome partitioning protein
MPVLGSYEVLIGEEDPIEVVVSTGDVEGLELPPNVSLIAARRNLENIDMALNSKHVFGNPKDVLRPLVDRLHGDYDYIFLDTAPNLTIPTVAAYKAADYFLLSAIPEPLAIEGLSAALEDIATVKKQGNASLRLIGVVLSAIKGRSTRLQRELIGYVEQQFDAASDPSAWSYKTRITETTYVCECQQYGKTMFQLFSDHKVTEEYRQLVRELEARLDALEGVERGAPVHLHAAGDVSNGEVRST